ncbi:MAG: M48 family metalloprotease [Candidatus Omnitrophica bacterium]|nr:M48 family metalloprotease [Candidatus Omnitrophota bacterium]
MPYSFTKIEKDKSKVIALIFCFLVVLYFLVFWITSVAVINYRLFSSSFSLSNPQALFRWPTFIETLWILSAAALTGLLHWLISTHNIIDKLLYVLKAEPADENDTYHQVFRNVVEEVTVATGGGRIIEPFVIPTMAMNAFALADFNGRCVIGVTEGVVSRLSRSQLEAVVGHEAAHIVSGDCVDTTITTALFELYSGVLFGVTTALQGSTNSSLVDDDDRLSVSGGGGALLLFIFVLLWLTKTLATLANMFVSRQREYRADAVAVRLTRNPLALAEALYAIAYHWRGSGLTAENLDAVFIISPKYSYMEERYGFWADWFATHPPFISRVKILLDMAHESMETMMRNVERRDQIPKATVSDRPAPAGRWMANKDGQWQGPFSWEDVVNLDWIQPQTWIHNLSEENIQMAMEDTRLAPLITGGAVANAKSGGCPKCGGVLKSEIYEGVSVQRCGFCQGILVKEDDVKKIIIRREYGFSPRTERLAEKFLEEGQGPSSNPPKGSDYNKAGGSSKPGYGIPGTRGLSKKATQQLNLNTHPDALLQCPQCHSGHMIKRFYTYVYRIEVDFCLLCRLMFFDKDELEILQCMIEKATKSS